MCAVPYTCERYYYRKELKPNYVGSHGKRDADSDLIFHVMASRKFTVNDVLGMCYDSKFCLSEDESICGEGRRSIPTVDIELFSLRRWPLFSKLSFLTRLVSQLALSRTMVRVLIVESQEL